MKKLTLAILSLGCILLTGCGAHLDRQNQGIATIKEGSVNESEFGFKTPNVDLDIKLPVKVQSSLRINIDKEFTYAKKNLSPELFKEFKQRIVKDLDYKQLFASNFNWTDSAFHWKKSWRSCKVQCMSCVSPIAPLFLIPLVYDTVLIPSQMLTSGGCGTIESPLALVTYNSKFLEVKFQEGPQRIILKCKRAKCRIEDENGNLIDTTPVITIQMVKNLQAEKELVQQIKEEAKEKERQKRKQLAAEAERKKRIANAKKLFGGTLGYCLFLDKVLGAQSKYPTIPRSAVETLLSDFSYLSCGRELANYYYEVKQRRAEVERARLQELGWY